MSKTILDNFLYNANGAVDPSSAGYKIIIDTLTIIRSKVVEQKFYEVAPADYVPVDVGEAAFADQIVQNLTFTTDGGFYQGDINNANGQGVISNVDVALSPLTMPTQFWAKTVNWTILELKQAALLNRWDIVESKLKALKKVWDLGIQEVAFMGHPIVSTMKGLINDSEVTNNLTTITKAISSMSASEFSTFIKTILADYFSNSNSTAMPDTFIMPTADYLGLGVPVSSTYPNISMLEYLTNTFRKMTRNESFEVLPLAYCESTNPANVARGISANRYVLYKKDPEVLSMSIPVDLTMLPAKTSNELQWSQSAYGQYSGVLINRKPEVLYFSY
jgi:hypothetical protein